jgi:hypothetical protein
MKLESSSVQLVVFRQILSIKEHSSEIRIWGEIRVHLGGLKFIGGTSGDGSMLSRCGE